MQQISSTQFSSNPPAILQQSILLSLKIQLKIQLFNFQFILHHIISLHRKLQSTAPEAPSTSPKLRPQLPLGPSPSARDVTDTEHSSSHFSCSREQAHDTPESYHTMASLSLHSALRSGPRAALRAFAAPKVVPLTARRHKSGPYGYTQAKALVYSTYGEPKDVLE